MYSCVQWLLALWAILSTSIIYWKESVFATSVHGCYGNKAWWKKTLFTCWQGSIWGFKNKVQSLWLWQNISYIHHVGFLLFYYIFQLQSKKIVGLTPGFYMEFVCYFSLSTGFLPVTKPAFVVSIWDSKTAWKGEWRVRLWMVGSADQ